MLSRVSLCTCQPDPSRLTRNVTIPIKKGQNYLVNRISCDILVIQNCLLKTDSHLEQFMTFWPFSFLIKTYRSSAFSFVRTTASEKKSSNIKKSFDWQVFHEYSRAIIVCVGIWVHLLEWEDYLYDYLGLYWTNNEQIELQSVNIEKNILRAILMKI